MSLSALSSSPLFWATFWPCLTFAGVALIFGALLVGGLLNDVRRPDGASPTKCC